MFQIQNDVQWRETSSFKTENDITATDSCTWWLKKVKLSTTLDTERVKVRTRWGQKYAKLRTVYIQFCNCDVRVSLG